MEKHNITSESISFKRTYLTLICEATDGEQFDPKIKQEIVDAVSRKIKSDNRKAKLLKYGLGGILLAAALLAGSTYLSNCLKEIPKDTKKAHVVTSKKIEDDMKKAQIKHAEQAEQTLKDAKEAHKKTSTTVDTAVKKTTANAQIGMAEKINDLFFK